MRSVKGIGILCILGTTIGYALVPSLSFMAFGEGISTETILFDKFLYASILIWTYIFIKRLPYRLNKEMFKKVAVVALAYVGINTTLYLSFDYISGSLATVISFTFPVMVITVEMISGKEKVNPIRCLAILFTVVGLAITVLSPDMELNMMGVMFALVCAMCYTIYTIGLSNETLKEGNPIVTAGYVLLTSTIINGVRCGVTGNVMISLSPYILLLAVACAFMPILLFCIGVRLIGATDSSVINTFEPVFACVFGAVFIGDTITTNMIIGAAIIVASVLFINLIGSRPERPEGSGTG